LYLHTLLLQTPCPKELMLHHRQRSFPDTIHTNIAALSPLYFVYYFIFALPSTFPLSSWYPLLYQFSLNCLTAFSTLFCLLWIGVFYLLIKRLSAPPFICFKVLPYSHDLHLSPYYPWSSSIAGAISTY